MKIRRNEVFQAVFFPEMEEVFSNSPSYFLKCKKKSGNL